MLIDIARIEKARTVEADIDQRRRQFRPQRDNAAEEYAADHIPGAVNCPVLDDSERAQVGLMYTQVSQFEARKIEELGVIIARVEIGLPPPSARAAS